MGERIVAGAPKKDHPIDERLDGRELQSMCQEETMRHRARSSSGKRFSDVESYNYKADLFRIRHFTLRWFCMPMYLYIITAVGNVLITPLRIGEPSPKMLLHER